jgi:hypothetical protein
MLSKAKTVSGTVVVVNQPKTGLPATYGGNETLEYLSIYEDSSRIGPFFPRITALKGDELTVVSAPRKIDRVNLVRVKTTSGVEGEVYWCELRASSSHK